METRPRKQRKDDGRVYIARPIDIPGLQFITSVEMLEPDPDPIIGIDATTGEDIRESDVREAVGA